MSKIIITVITFLMLISPASAITYDKVMEYNDGGRTYYTYDAKRISNVDRSSSFRMSYIVSWAKFFEYYDFVLVNRAWNGQPLINELVNGDGEKITQAFFMIDDNAYTRNFRINTHKRDNDVSEFIHIQLHKDDLKEMSEGKTVAISIGDKYIVIDWMYKCGIKDLLEETWK